MKVGDKVYYIESKKVKEAEVIKITRDFVTLRYKTYVPSGQHGGHMETNIDTKISDKATVMWLF